MRLLILFITIPLIEFYLFMTVGDWIGVFPTIVIIILTGFIGAKLTRSQGLKTLINFRKATAEGRMPHAEIVDGVMILVAGAVLLTPGFLTDVFGFALLVPPVRALLRKRFGHSLKSKVHVAGMPQAEKPTSEKVGGTVVIDAEVEVIEQRND